MYCNSIVSSLFMTATKKLLSLKVKWIAKQWHIPLYWLAKIEILLPLVYSVDCKKSVGIWWVTVWCWWLWWLILDSLLDCCPSNVPPEFSILIQSFNESSIPWLNPNWMYYTPRGTWPKSTIRLSHYMRLASNSTALTRWFYHPFSLTKIPSNYH